MEMSADNAATSVLFIFISIQLLRAIIQKACRTICLSHATLAPIALLAEHLAVGRHRVASQTPRSYVIGLHLRQRQFLANVARTVWVGAVAALPFVGGQLDCFGEGSDGQIPLTASEYVRIYATLIRNIVTIAYNRLIAEMLLIMPQFCLDV